MWSMPLSPLYANEELDRYIGMLNAQDSQSRIIAARGIAGFQHNAKKAVLPMTKLLKDNNIEVRLAALNAYAEIGIYAKQAIPAIETQLTHTNPYVRYYAAVALHKSGSPEAMVIAKPILDLGSPEAVMEAMLKSDALPQESEEMGPPMKPTRINSPQPPVSPKIPKNAAPLPLSTPLRP